MKLRIIQRRRLLAVYTLLLSLAFGTLGCAVPAQTGSQASTTPSQTPPTSASTVRAGAQAPDFQLQTFSGHTVKLSDLSEKKVFLNFWASWCGPCQNEMPALQKMARQYADQVQVYGVNMTSDDTMEMANSFLVEHGVTFPNLIDDKGVMKNTYHIFAYPVSMTIDENGTIVERHDGELTLPQMQAMFEHLAKTKAR